MPSDSFEGTASGVPKAESVGVHEHVAALEAPDGSTYCICGFLMFGPRKTIEKPARADAGKELRAKVKDLPQIRYVASGDDTEPSGYYVPLDAVLALLSEGKGNS